MKCTRFFSSIAAMSAMMFTAPSFNYAAAQDAAKTINDMCPIGKEAIVTSVKTIEYKGHTLGFCCPGCDDAFLAWDETRKDEFVRLALADKEPGMETHSQDDAAQVPADEITSDPYLLDTCIVTGMKLGSMGDPIVQMFTVPGADRFPHFAGEREVRFCCAGCVEKFQADMPKYFAAIDEKMIAQQMPYYPLDTCVVMEQDRLDEMSKPVDLIYQNRLVRFCCNMCVQEFNDDPKQYLDKIDAAIIKQQSEHYPLDTCVVMENSKLGSMGEPIEKVYGTRLVKFCCASCIKKFEDNPTAFIARLDKAWKDSGHMPGVAAEWHDGHEGDHGNHGNDAHGQGEQGHGNHDHKDDGGQS
ncbi:MAG: hypothetical protein ACR2GY_01220 [Phycisphaerales bacterium]